MIKALLVPTSAREDVKVVNLETTREWQINWHKANPYFVAKELLDDGWTERVRLPIPDVFMYVDEDGYGKQLPVNEHATGVLYPGQIVGKVLIVRELEVGPDIFLKDMYDMDIKALASVLGTPIVTNS